MPRFDVYYCTEVEYCVVVEAENEEEARECWMDQARWDDEPERVREDMMDTEVYIVEAN